MQTCDSTQKIVAEEVAKAWEAIAIIYTARIRNCVLQHPFGLYRNWKRTDKTILPTYWNNCIWFTDNYLIVIYVPYCQLCAHTYGQPCPWVTLNSQSWTIFIAQKNAHVIFSTSIFFEWWDQLQKALPKQAQIQCAKDGRPLGKIEKTIIHSKLCSKHLHNIIWLQLTCTALLGSPSNEVIQQSFHFPVVQISQSCKRLVYITLSGHLSDKLSSLTIYFPQPDSLNLEIKIVKKGKS